MIFAYNSNPAYPGLVLNLSTILHETREVTRVFILGLELGIPDYILEGMENDFPHNLERRKAALFSHWLRTDVNASWRNIVTALQNMGEIRVSKRIAGKNCKLIKELEQTENNIISLHTVCRSLSRLH